MKYNCATQRMYNYKLQRKLVSVRIGYSYTKAVNQISMLS